MEFVALVERPKANDGTAVDMGVRRSREPYENWIGIQGMCREAQRVTEDVLRKTRPKLIVPG